MIYHGEPTCYYADTLLAKIWLSNEKKTWCVELVDLHNLAMWPKPFINISSSQVVQVVVKLIIYKQVINTIKATLLGGREISL